MEEHICRAEEKPKDGETVTTLCEEVGVVVKSSPSPKGEICHTCICLMGSPMEEKYFHVLVEIN